MSEQGPTVFNGRYELLRHIARGGMADVYLARDDLLNREVALKVLFPEFAEDPNFVERFRREAQAAANLNHPNIVGIYDWGQERGTYYIVMEHVQGRSMADVVRASGPLSPDRAAEIAVDVAAALGTAHAAGLVHRDVKLGNILLSDGGDVKVADFGIATAALAGVTESGLTQHGSVMGTATYFSPEQAQGKPLDGRSDLYSLGVCLYEMLAGVPPFQADTPVAVAYKHVQEKPTPLRERGVELAPSLEAITMKTLAKNPANRYPTAEDLRSDLSRYLAGSHKLPGGAVVGGAAAAGAIAGAAAAGVAGADATVAQPVTPTGATSQVGAGVDPTTALDTGYPPGFQYYDDEPPESGGGWARSAGLLFILALLVGLLGFLVVAFWNSLDGDDSGDAEEGELIEVERYIGLDVNEATERILEAGLRVDVQLESNSEVPADEVFDQDPPAGERVEDDTVIVLNVSAGDASVVPSVVGQSVDEARARLTEAGYTVLVVEEHDAQDEGTVIAQDPLPNEELGEGSPVTITVSLGPEQFPVPDVTGDPLLEALDKLNENFRVTSQVDEGSSSIPAGNVIRTDPPKGTLLGENAPVTVVVSSGTPKVQVPNVVGLLANTAVERIEADGLVAVPDLIPVPAGSPDVGKVVDQTPPAFVTVDVGSAVTILVGEAEAPTTTTTAPTTTTTAGGTTTTTTAAP